MTGLPSAVLLFQASPLSNFTGFDQSPSCSQPWSQFNMKQMNGKQDRFNKTVFTVSNSEGCGHTTLTFNNGQGQLYCERTPPPRWPGRQSIPSVLKDSKTGFQETSNHNSWLKSCKIGTVMIPRLKVKNILEHCPAKKPLLEWKAHCLQLLVSSDLTVWEAYTHAHNSHGGDITSLLPAILYARENLNLLNSQQEPGTQSRGSSPLQTSYSLESDSMIYQEG